VILRSAFVSRPVHISGWDVASNKPKQTARMVAPGSVYFFTKGNGKNFTGDEARSLWLSAIGGRTKEGFGRVVPGVWNLRGNDND
jgi:CRISPR-associated protein Cmr3